MTTTQWIRITPGPAIEAPRGAAMVAALARMVSAAARSVHRALEASGRRRAANALREHALWCRDHDPARAQLLLEASRFDPRESRAEPRRR
jgi:hypothetical protein